MQRLFISSYAKLFLFASPLFYGCAEEEPESFEPVIVKNDDVAIAYTQSGSNDTALVFVHGWAIDKSYWQGQVDFFSKRFTVVTIDIGGHGESGHNRGDWTIPAFADDVVAVIDSLHLSKVILIGHSMGGDIILDAAYKKPSKVIGFVGIDNFKDVGVQYTPDVQQQINAFVEALKTNYRETAVAYSRESLFPAGYADTVLVNRVLHDIAAMDSVVAIGAIESAIAASPKALLLQLKVPVHLIVSDYTPVMEDSLRKYCRSGYALKTIKGTGHYPMIEKPGEFNQLLEETITEISKSR